MDDDLGIVLGVQQFNPDDRYEVACARVKPDGSVEQWRQDVVGFAIVVHMCEDEVGDFAPDSSLEPMVLDDYGNVQSIWTAFATGVAHRIVRRGQEPRVDMANEARVVQARIADARMTTAN